MESNLSSDQAEPSRRRRRRGGKERHPHGRAWVIILWIILRISDLPIAWLAFRAFNAMPQMRLDAIVSILWTTALFIALWARQIWASYVTAIFLGIGACWWGYNAATLTTFYLRTVGLISKESIVILMVATLIYLCVAVTIVRSKNIEYLTDPTAGCKPREF
jgi:hypothetical protein